MRALLGIALMAGALLGVALVLRRRRVERSFLLFSSAGRWEEALPHARALAGFRAPGTVRGRRQMNLGKILARLGRLDEARGVYAEALATQGRAGDPYVALTRLGLAELELAAGRAAEARAHAEAATGEEFRARSILLVAASHLVGGAPERTRELLGPEEARLRESRRPSDVAALAVLAAARAASGDEPGARSLSRLVHERLAPGPRQELAAQLPFLAKVLGA